MQRPDDDELDLSDDELEGSNDDSEADRILEEMRRMNEQAKAACDTVDGSTKTNDSVSEDLHRKLCTNILSLIQDVASGSNGDADEAAESAAPPSSAALAAAPPSSSSSTTLTPEEASMLAELEASTANITLQEASGSYSAVDMLAPGRATAGVAGASGSATQGKTGRFALASSSAVGTKATVSDISRLASKPLISDDWAPPPRRPGATGGGRGGRPGRGGGAR
jgi:hypothetical protein